jgi:hypothetical protein
MKMTKIMSASAVLLGLTVASQAQTTIYLSGSTAFRTQIYNGLKDLGLTLSTASSTSPAGNNSEFYSGTVTATSFNGQAINETGDSFNIFCAFTGSAEGINTLANPQGPGNTSPPYTSSTGSAVSYTGGADLAMSDVLYSTTQYATAAGNANGGNGLTEAAAYDINPNGPGGMAVVPFAFATTEYALTNGVTNVTDNLVNALLSSGKIDLSFFSGNAGDSNYNVYLVGRTNDSGTRYTAQLVSGYNTAAAVKQYALGVAGENDTAGHYPPGIQTNAFTTVGQTNFVLVGNDGYASGGNIAKVLSAAPVSSNGIAIGYVSWADITGNMTSGVGGPIAFNGIPATSVNPVNWTTTSAWNTNALFNGAYTYWSYEHMYENPNVSSGSTIDLFGHDLVNAMIYEITNSAVITAAQESQLDVYRSGDGSIIKHN